MKTVTFFSYKGGTGRSLAVANASRYLARLGFKVVALDFDLEAPGLHYKFTHDRPLEVKAGVVDFLCDLIKGDSIQPPELERCCIAIPDTESVSGSITLIPAGRVHSEEYWPRLASLNWHQLFYAEAAIGVKVFLELKRRIETELQPDFLLIDSRTGITEMGGVATAILPDAVISLVLRTVENLEGSRAVLRSLIKTRKSFELPPLGITVALSRVPTTTETEAEEFLKEEVRNFLNEPAATLSETLAIDRVEVLHIDEALQTTESLRVGGDLRPHDSILYRDYLRFFQCLVTEQEMAPRIEAFLKTLRERMLEAPDIVERDLKEFVEVYGHPVAFRELLRFLKLRNRNDLETLRYAQTYWHINDKNGDDDLLRYFVTSDNLREKKRSLSAPDTWDWMPDVEFIESVWLCAGAANTALTRILAEIYAGKKQYAEAARILRKAVENPEAPVSIVIDAISTLTDLDLLEEAQTIASSFQSRLGNHTEFFEACRRCGYHSIPK